jgi:hypothetical protein
MSQVPETTSFGKGCSSEAIEGHFCVPGHWLAGSGRRGCRVSLILLNRRRVEPQCLVEGLGELLRRHHGARRKQWREARDQPFYGLVAAGDRRGRGLDNG